MHERTTRALARWMFVACCAVPTCLTLLAVLVSWTPWYDNLVREKLERRLCLQTGLSVEIGRFERSDPQSWKLFDVRLADAETLKTIATARSVRWVAVSDRTSIILSQPEIQVGLLDHVGRLLHDRFLCRPEQTQGRVHIVADDLTLRGGSASQTIRDLDARLTSEGPLVSVDIRCIPAGDESYFDGIHAQVVRDRSTVRPTTSWSLQTGGIALSVSTLGDYLPDLNRLGAEATFKGILSGQRQDGFTETFGTSGWAFDLAGEFSHVDLGRLTEELPHRVTGLASISLARCRFGPPEVSGGVNILGELRSSSGWMSASLLPRLAEDLGCRLTAVTADDFSYDALAMSFELYGSQLRVGGICRTQPGQEWLEADVAVSSAGRPVVLATDRWLPATHLARLFASPHSVSVPLSRQTVGLLQILQPPAQTLPQAMPQGASGLAEQVQPLMNTPVEPGPQIHDPRIQSSRLEGSRLEGSGVEGSGMLLPESSLNPAARIGRLQPWSQTPQSIAQPY